MMMAKTQNQPIQFLIKLNNNTKTTCEQDKNVVNIIMNMAQNAAIPLKCTHFTIPNLPGLHFELYTAGNDVSLRIFLDKQSKYFNCALMYGAHRYKYSYYIFSLFKKLITEAVGIKATNSEAEKISTIAKILDLIISFGIKMQDIHYSSAIRMYCYYNLLSPDQLNYENFLNATAPINSAFKETHTSSEALHASLVREEQAGNLNIQRTQLDQFWDKYSQKINQSRNPFASYFNFWKKNTLSYENLVQHCLGKDKGYTGKRTLAILLEMKWLKENAQSKIHYCLTRATPPEFEVKYNEYTQSLNKPGSCW
ncbi:MAG: hypothetical protein KIT27_02235 [Legionellales bacterium]|nr:hypothetical protein [Legionellales bacterium]